MKRFFFYVGLTLLSISCSDDPSSENTSTPNSPETEARRIITRVAFPNLTFDQPVNMLTVPNDTQERLIIGERDGRILWIESDESTTETRTVIDLTNEVGLVHDGGLLGLVLHPNFGNGSNFLYMWYSSKDAAGADFPSEYLSGNDGRTQDCTHEEFFGNFLFLRRLELNPETLEPIADSFFTMIKIRMYGTSHRGGGMVFGNDGLLYITTSDQTAWQKAQDISTNLDGGILRIDVNQDPARSNPPHRTIPEDFGFSDEFTGRGYGIPNDNPFVNEEGTNFEEYFTLGHRNPYRITMDSETGLMYIGEVGQRNEEVNVLQRGGNYGWPAFDAGGSGEDCVPILNNMSNTPPLTAFPRDETVITAVIGGYVYRGNAIPELQGRYLCGDYAATRLLFAIDIENGSFETFGNVTEAEGNIIGFAEDHNREIYILLQSGNGKILRIDAVGEL